MSKECCGDSAPVRGNLPRAVVTAAAHHPASAGGGSCCAAEPSEPSRVGLPTAGPQTAGACCAETPNLSGSAAVETGDACCGDDGVRASADGDQDAIRPPWWRDPALAPSAIAGVGLLAGYVLAWAGLELPALVLHWMALIAGATTFVPGAVRRLLRGRLGVGLLMTIAAIGAVLLGQIAEAAALAFLFSLAEALEDRAMDRAKEGLRALLVLIPETVRISRMSGDISVPAAEVRELDIMVIGAGERVATDGVVVAGRSSIDTSAITGESIPVEVAPGDPVPAGAVNGSGTLQIEATADGRDNSLTQIVALVEQAHARKGDRARMADRIARPLVPAVMIAAGLVAMFGFIVGDPATWVERALVVLVAASPCAMAIAVPVTVISAIGAASRFGVVIKSGEAFERMGTIRTVALDKTGTLTSNQPQVVGVHTMPGWSRADVVRLAAAVEASSTHPLATAILAAAASEVSGAGEITEHPGHGVTGMVSGTQVRVGNVRWLDPAELRGAADLMAADGMTVVVVEADGVIVGMVGVRDELRPEVPETVDLLRQQGIGVVMLTGDNARTAAALAARAGIDDVRAEQLPADKAAAIETLSRSGPTAMVGDGINDAPALATATVGIAMGVQGSAAAIESADVAFTGHDLRLLPGAFVHARRGRRIMTANIALALLIIVGLFPFALLGILGLAGVVLVHELAEVVVILNGLRAARRPSQTRIAAPATVSDLAVAR